METVKKLILFVTASLLVLAVTSCVDRVKDNTDFEDVLSQAQSFIETNPDSSLLILIGVRENIPVISESQQARYAFMTAQAMELTNTKFTTDTLAKTAVKYFKKRPRYEKAYSLYLLGKANRDMKRSEDAAEFFNQALMAMNRIKNQDDTKVIRLKGKIFDNLGSVYWKHNLFEEALSKHEAAIESFRMINDSAGMMIGMRNCGRVAASLQRFDVAKQYYENALLIARMIDNQPLGNSINLELGRDCFMAEGNFAKAIETILMSLQLREKDTDSDKDNDIDICNMTLGVLYYYTDNYELARKHLDTALRSKRAGLKMSCYQTLYAIEYNSGNYLKAMEYQDLFTENMMKADEEHRSENMQRIKTDYDLKIQKAELVNAQRLRNFKLYLVIAIVIIVLLFIILIIKQKMAKGKLSAEQLKSQMERDRNRINELVSDMENLIRKNDELRTDTQTLSQKELMMTNLILTRNKVYCTAQSLTEQTTAETLNFKLSESDWADFINLTDLIYDGFSQRLLSLFPKLTKWDIRICCLSKHQFSNHVISILLDTQTDSYYRRKSRIKQLKMNVTDDNRSFEDIVNEI